MGKCTIIGKIRVPASVGQAILLNGKKCDEETVWTINAFGGESHVTDFTIENRSNVDFDIDLELSTPTDGEYTMEILDALDAPVTLPFNITKETVNWKFKITFDKYIASDEYEIILTLDYV